MFIFTAGKKALEKIFSVTILRNQNLKYAQDLLYTSNHPSFFSDPQFLAAYQAGKEMDGGLTLGKTASSDIHWRLHVICWAAKQASRLEGDFVDCGVGGGMFSRTVMDFLDFKSLKKRYFLFDTFNGLDERFSSPKEMIKSRTIGYHKVNTLTKVQDGFEGYPVVIVPGAIPETLNLFDDYLGNKVAYLSIDMNCVKPEVSALEFFWDRLVPGGVIVLDDYGYPGADEQRNAHDRFANEHNANLLVLPTCQAVIIKS